MDRAPAPHADPKAARSLGDAKRRRAVFWIGGLGILALLAGTLWVVDRALRPAANTDAKLRIEQVSNQAAERRGSITDQLNRPPDPDQHPLTPALDVARAGLRFFRENVRDYQATFIKQERIGQRLRGEEQMDVKIRQARPAEGDRPAVPFSVYMRFLAPQSVAGREVIFIEGHNDGRLLAHEAGLLGIATVHLLPTSRLAMRGNRYPITHIGIENMILRMIEKGERDLQYGECELQVDRSIRLNGHPGTEIRLIHPVPRDYFDFHIARILVDDSLNVPIGYEGYGWPEVEGGPPVLIERYYYANLKLNVGLSDHDFDPKNENYDFP